MIHDLELQRLKKHELKDLQRAVCSQLKKRYAKNRPAKYGSLNKGFTHAQLQHFLKHVTSPTALVVFKLQAYLGLRVGEAVRLRYVDLDLAKRRLWVRSSKDTVPTMLFLHEEIYPALQGWVEDHIKDIEQTGWIFPARFDCNRHGHISQNFVRNAMRIFRKAAGLEFYYGESDEGYPGRKRRRLCLLTTHSLRHYFITRVHDRTANLLITAKLARHVNTKHTLRYIYTQQEAIDAAMAQTFA